MPLLDSLGKLRDRVLAHSPENPMNVADLTAGLSSLIGRASKMPGSMMDKARLGRDLALSELNINKNLPMSEMPHEVLKALEMAAATGPGDLKPTQRAARAARDMLGLSPEAMKARRELAREARAAEEASKQTRRNLALAGLGGLGLVGAAAAMNRRADDPDTYKHSSELGWQPRRLLRQKVAARAQRAPAAPRFQIPGGFSGAQLQQAAQMAAQNVQMRPGGRLAQADASRAGTRQFTEAQARQFLMRNPNAARAAFSGLQTQPAAPTTGGSQMWQQMVPGRVPAAPQVVPAPTMIGSTPINQVGGGGVGLLNAFTGSR